MNSIDEKIKLIVEGKFRHNPGAEKFAENKSGIEKAKDVLSILTRKNIETEKVAFLSIGGADGTEIEHLLLNSNSNYGILLEYDDYLSERARKKSLELFNNYEKNLKVFTGDAIQKLNIALDQAIAWKKEGKIDLLVTSIHALLHEFPNRGSKTTDLEGFLHNFIRDNLPVLLIAREPCMPKDLPEFVYMSACCSSESIAALANKIKLSHPEFALLPEPRILAKGVKLPSVLAMETLIKLFYLDSFNYEIQERVTSFKRDEYVDTFRRVFGTDDVRHEDIQTGSFEKRWKEFGITIEDEDLRRLAKPQMHVRIIAESNLNKVSALQESKQSLEENTIIKAKHEYESLNYPKIFAKYKNGEDIFDFFEKIYKKKRSDEERMAFLLETVVFNFYLDKPIWWKNKILNLTQPNNLIKSAITVLKQVFIYMKAWKDKNYLGIIAVEEQLSSILKNIKGDNYLDPIIEIVGNDYLGLARRRLAEHYKGEKDYVKAEESFQRAVHAFQRTIDLADKYEREPQLWIGYAGFNLSRTIYELYENGIKQNENPTKQSELDELYSQWQFKITQTINTRAEWYTYNLPTPINESLYTEYIYSMIDRLQKTKTNEGEILESGKYRMNKEGFEFVKEKFREWDSQNKKDDPLSKMVRREWSEVEKKFML